jgi:galactokinase
VTTAAGDPPATLAALAAAARDHFQTIFGGTPTLLVAAPGRVNLIGEHTDYNGGFVLPLAIDRHLVAAAAPAPGRRWRVFSAQLQAQADLELDAPLRRGAPPWADYLRGVLAGFQERGLALPALDVVLQSNLPLGGGLSSSAALEVAAATLIEAAAGRTLDVLDKARLCQRAEQWAGVPCGIMDQLVAVAGQPAGALLIDCDSEGFQVVPLPEDEVGVLVTDSGVRHALGDGEYARRRQECTEAARLLGVASLRAVTADRLAAAALPPPLDRRARHVVDENARVLAFVQAFQRRDFAAAGALLYDSHRSLRDDYQVSCPELDTLVEIARALGPGAGVFGARLTGGGFGGCTVSLVDRRRLPEVAAAIAAEYQRRTGRPTAPFAVRASAGARKLVLDDVLF